jgi:hypothetical protein
MLRVAILIEIDNEFHFHIERGGNEMTCGRVVLVLALATAGWGGTEALAGPDEVPGESSPEAGGSSGSGEVPATPVGAQPPDLAELERRIGVLAEELERLRSGESPEAELTPEDARALGLAPSAASLYRQRRGVSIAGYGEMLYENFASADQSGAPTNGGAQLDFLRAIVYTGYRFNDQFLFNSEIEVEHADEISVEFAYVDYLAHESLGVRAGMLLVPMGLVNEFHEPTVFLGAKRPETETRLIPSTWRENGLGIHGSAGRLAYRAYVLNGLDARGFSASGLRGGRQKGARALASDMAFVGRLDFTPTPGAFVGASLYTGGSGQGLLDPDGRTLQVGTTLFEVHGQLQLRGLDLRALYARAEIGDAAALNRALALQGPAGVAEALQGGYLQLGYDVLSQVAAGDAALTLYYRFEKLDTQAEMPAGFERAPGSRSTFNTLGLELKPIPGVVLKADYQLGRSDARTGRNQFNLALGYAF